MTEDNDFLNKIDMGYIGLSKPNIKHVKEPHDKHSYARMKAAARLGIPESELADEPDNAPESPEQAWA